MPSRLLRGLPAAGLALLLLRITTAAQATSAPSEPIVEVDAAELEKRITFLASDEMKGRETGSPEIARCAEYIAGEFESFGLKPADGKSWYQPCKVAGRDCRNVLGILPGRDLAAKNQFVVVGAHYDHVGIGRFGSLSGEAGAGAIHNGADDNASGTATMLELAQAFSKRPSRRPILFIAFTGEELGLLGSKFYCEHPVIPLEKVVAMVNLDMVGRSTRDYLFVGGVGTGKGFDRIVTEANRKYNFDIESKPGGLGPSDMDSFYRKKIPVLFFFTNEHPDYHRPSDDADRINYTGAEKVGRLAYTVISEIANTSKKYEYQAFEGQALPDSMAPGRGATGLTLGVEWDPATTDLRIRAFSNGSAAEKAGMKVGDVVRMVDGKEVTKPSQISSLLAWKKRRDQVAVSVERGTKRLRITVTL